MLPHYLKLLLPLPHLSLKDMRTPSQDYQSSQAL
jgi:hypothetical protein